MFRSMTAYGKASVATKMGSFLVEIHSVNRKSLDVAVNLPKELLGFDMELRKELSTKVRRGFLTIRITKEDHKEEHGLSLPDVELLRLLQHSLQAKAKVLGYDPKEALPFDRLIKYGMARSSSYGSALDERLQSQLMEGFKEALGEFIAMRDKEGEMLLKDIDSWLKKIEKQLDWVVKKIRGSVEKFRERLEKRLHAFQLLEGEGEERVAREIVIFADKVDATEEITRLRSHIYQFQTLLQSKKQHIGSELNFLLQEMNREVNTVAAKSQDAEVTKAILEIKTDQEKIREQVQNIE